MVEREFLPVRFAILTVSDTRGRSEDRSGDYLEAAIKDDGHRLVHREIVKDEEAEIAAFLRAQSAREDVDAIITTGGTGLTGRDVSVEAHQSVYDKEISAFATVFTMISFQKIGTSAVQSRACAGVVNGKYCFALPGSPSACKDAWQEILRPQFDYRHMPCNFVEIFPRLDEHLRRK